jgi:hypothetical protein
LLAGQHLLLLSFTCTATPSTATGSISIVTPSGCSWLPCHNVCRAPAWWHAQPAAAAAQNSASLVTSPAANHSQLSVTGACSGVCWPVSSCTTHLCGLGHVAQGPGA